MKCYVVGELDKLKQTFPDYRGNDERQLSDGNWIYECELTESEQKTVTNIGLTVYDHAGIVARLKTVVPSKPKKSR